MPRLSFTIEGCEYAELPHFGQEHILARLAEGDAKKLAFPIFSLKKAKHVSGSVFLDKAASASAIAEQNPKLPPPPAKAHYVVAGQQAGLLTGPMYTFLKAVSLVAISRRIQEKAKAPIVPLFWVASEDHDVLEVNRVTVNGKRFVHEYPDGLKSGEMPQVADISIEDAREPLLEHLKRSLPETEFTTWVLDMAASADYSSFQTAFADMLRAIFAEWELYLTEPMSLRHLTSPALASLVEHWPEITKALDKGSEMLKAHGFEPPLSAPGIFEIVDGKRVALEFGETGVRLSTGEVSFEGASDEINRRPMDFSPNAALRPIIQDAALPVAATLGGPTELLYLWQIDLIYKASGWKRSLIFPRISATFVEEKILRSAKKAGLTGGSRAFSTGSRAFSTARLLSVSELVRDYAPEEEDDPEVRALERLRTSISAELEKILKNREPNWLPKRKASVEYGLDYIIRRLKEDALEKAGLGRKRLEKIEAAVSPRGKPHERVVNILEFLNLHGPGFTRQSVEKLDPLLIAHQLVCITTEKGE